MSLFISLLGWTGMALLLLSFAFQQRIRGNIYFVLNAIGALLIAIYCIYSKAWPPAVLNIVWLLVAIRSLLIRKRSMSHSWSASGEGHCLKASVQNRHALTHNDRVEV